MLGLVGLKMCRDIFMNLVFLFVLKALLGDSDGGLGPGLETSFVDLGLVLVLEILVSVSLKAICRDHQDLNNFYLK